MLIFVIFCALELIIYIGSNSASRQWHAILRSTEPLIFLCPWLIEMRTLNLPKSSEPETSGLATPQDYIESLLNSPGGNRKTIGSANHTKVAEYLLKGIQRSEIHSPHIPEPNTPNKNKALSMPERVIKRLFGCCFEESGDYEQYDPAESLQCSVVMGYPGMLGEREVLSKKELYKAARTEHVVALAIGTGAKAYNYEEEYLDKHEMQNIRFVCLAPKLFDSIRNINDINYDEFLHLFDVSNLFTGDLKVRDEKEMHITDSKEQYVLKHISCAEYEVLKSVLEASYTHVLMNPNTCIWPILGCYLLEVHEGPETGAYAFIVQKTLREDISEAEASCSESFLVAFFGYKELRPADTSVFVTTKAAVLSSKELYKKKSQLNISHEQLNSLVCQLTEDTRLFAKHGIVNYFLGTFIIETPFHQCVNKLKPEISKATNTGVHDLILQELHTPGYRKFFVFFECTKRKDEAKVIYIVVNPSDMKAVKNLEKQKGSHVINFPSMLNTCSVKEYTSMLKQLDMPEGDNPRRNSLPFDLPAVNQIILQDKTSYEDNDLEASISFVQDGTPRYSVAKDPEQTLTPAQEMKEYYLVCVGVMG
eukprot:TRINITY_DN4289_c0_g1_i3.p1 TRINITY_DN4289_c0_g1~~TRINITY_DN4289_c0_g1_i3.p1  ORF type:complete len:592 (+),score=135.03 TRINITY_DN4289_c0_g1_i3:895-2670(+)